MAAAAVCAVFAIAGRSVVAAASAFSDANWTALGSGMNGPVFALTVSGTNVYAGGNVHDGRRNSGQFHRQVGW